MILIIESGSSKSDIIGIDNQGTIIIKSEILGLNPEILSNEQIVERILNSELKTSDYKQTERIFFYGAGCGTCKAKERLSESLNLLFRNAQITIYEDTFAACFACNPTLSEGVICILGTGSNCSYFDGQKLIQKVESLGYIIMDDAGGVSFGRKLLRAFYFNQMPEELQTKLQKMFNLEADAIKSNLYKSNNPNAYLASLARFVILHKKHPFINQLIHSEFQEFINNQIKQFDNYQQVPIHFVGSIAYFLQEELNAVAQKNKIKIGNIIQKPIEGLVKFHLEQNNIL